MWRHTGCTTHQVRVWQILGADLQNKNRFGAKEQWFDRRKRSKILVKCIIDCSNITFIQNTIVKIIIIDITAHCYEGTFHFIWLLFLFKLSKLSTIFIETKIQVTNFSSHDNFKQNFMSGIINLIDFLLVKLKLFQFQDGSVSLKFFPNRPII